MRKRNKNKRQQQTNKASTSNKDLNCDTSVAALPGGNGCYYVEEPATSSLPSSSGVPHGVGSSEGVGGLGGQQSSHHQFNHGMSHQHRPSSTTSKESETEMTTSGYLRYLQPLHHHMVIDIIATIAPETGKKLIDFYALINISLNLNESFFLPSKMQSFLLCFLPLILR